MSGGFELDVDAERWRRHLTTVVEATPGIVPVVKGNGYGLGRDLLAAESTRLGLGTIAVGTYREVPEALAAFGGDVMVLTPWRPFFDHVVLDDRVIHTMSRVEDIAALAAAAPGARVLLEGETSMARHGLDRHELAAAVGVLGDLQVEGFAIHLPLGPNGRAGGNFAEAQSWAAVLEASQVETTTLYVSHLTAAELTALRTHRPNLDVRPRIGTSLWLGDLGALSVHATVLDAHLVARGERIGYRQKPMPRDGTLLVIAGGTSHGIGLEAPKASSGAVQRGKLLAKGGLEAAGFSLSPFTIAGKQRWFAEPPHMQASMIFLPAGSTAPEVGTDVDVAVRFTTATFDAVNLR
ncbi:alanine racemase [Aeromicrobium chenweiae]|uniref:Alanine racemase n=1 Tax=Aeromicrobium chenweiae TaxID=2079793 RepID=A0A2S0WRH8_9ACTN|nr:alanine racemase [Aeromicrobium chenweiae]AWB93936.1 alanine racemase [Aeromicrobium chenweiae]TGN30983.1 alanine racemase [Aeromicrobium chenweiae]